jgi:photosystem II stability/assembly factor-like uncharacterized protein
MSSFRIPTTTFRRAIASVGLLGLAVLLSVPGAVAASPTPASFASIWPSAIGLEAVSWMVVSPAYSRTGVVMVVSTSMRCKTNCGHIWVTRDRGSTWRQAAASGWTNGRIAMGVDGNGKEVVFGSGNTAVLRSDDLGETWRAVGTGGMPTVKPSFGSDGAVAVANPSRDYVLTSAGASQVKGSAGTETDTQFSFPPAGGSFSALLGATDPRTHGLVVLQCDASLTCANATPLLGTSAFSGTVTMFPSTAYAQDGVVFAHTSTRIYKSSNGGLTFTPVSIVPKDDTNTSVPMMALGPGYAEASPRTLYSALFQVVGTGQDQRSSGGVFRSDDGGATWHSYGSPSVFDQGTFGVAATPDGRVFGGYVNGSGGAGLLCNPNGSGWRVSCADQKLAADPTPLPRGRPTPAANGKPATALNGASPGHGSVSSSPDPTVGATTSSFGGLKGTRAAWLAGGALLALALVFGGAVLIARRFKPGPR